MSSDGCPVFPHLPDSPTQSSKDDKLNRDRLAKQIAEHLISRSTHECMVYGLTGSWGTGKTSLLNLVERHVRAGSSESEDSWTAVVRFDPWNYSSLEQLISMFFRELRIELVGGASQETAWEIGDALESLAVLLMPLAAIPGLQAAGLISSALSPIGSLLKRKAGKKSLADVKQQIDRLIIDMKARLIILVDDLDRLEPDQAALILRLIRLNADFANTTYVLAFDPERTQALLNTHYGEAMAEGYVDKIVQVPFSLPVVDEQYIREELVSALLPLFEAINGDAELESRWRAIAGAGFFDYFTTLRDVKRFVNSLGLTLPLVWGEVNPLDFLATETIRLHDPALYFRIHAEKELFMNTPLDLRSAVAMHIGMDSEQRSRVEDAEKFQTLVGSSGEMVLELLRELFPQLATLEGDSEHRSGSDLELEWSSERRICSIDHFETYFMLTVPRGRISEKQLQEAMAATRSRTELSAFLETLERSSQAEQLLNRFSAHISDLDEKGIENTLLALMDVGDVLSGKGVPDPDPAYALRISYYVLTLVRAVQDREKSIELLQRTLRDGEGIYSVTRLASSLDDLTFKGKRLFSDEQLEALRNIAVERIRRAASDLSLLDAPWPVFILFRWLEWESEPARPAGFVRTCLSNDDSLLKAVDAFATSVHVLSASESGVSVEHKFPLDELRHLVPLKDWERALPRARSLLKRGTLVEDGEERELTDRELQMLRLFEKAVINPTRNAHDDGPEEGNV